jgi:hypothetical protein
LKSSVLSFSQKTGISEESNTDVKHASRGPNGFIASICFMAPDNVKIFQVLISRNDYIMQNYYVMWDFFYSMHQNYKKKKIVDNFCLHTSIFKSYIGTCNIVFFADKTKLIPFIYHKNILDTALSNTVQAP